MLLITLLTYIHAFVADLQYYFGDFNLLKDSFLQREIQKNAGGCILFATLYRRYAL